MDYGLNLIKCCSWHRAGWHLIIFNLSFYIPSLTVLQMVRVCSSCFLHLSFKLLEIRPNVTQQTLNKYTANKLTSKGIVVATDLRCHHSHVRCDLRNGRTGKKWGCSLVFPGGHSSVPPLASMNNIQAWFLSLWSLALLIYPSKNAQLHITRKYHEELYPLSSLCVCISFIYSCP